MHIYTMTPVFRFAPSPTGYLHLGHAFSAWLNYHAAQAQQGQCLLRMEDIDPTRCQARYAKAIEQDLRWLGLDWPRPIRVQSAHMADYAQALQSLRDKALLYRCFHTRKEVAQEIARAPHQHGEGPQGHAYHGPQYPLSADEEQARIASGQAYAWRLSMRRAKDWLGSRFDDLGWHEQGSGPSGEQGWIAAHPQSLGDVILARKSYETSYHLAVVHDDAQQGVTHVMRGQDLFALTHLHVLLQALFGVAHPAYHHHALILDAKGKRLAKRDSSIHLQALRQAGHTPDSIRKRLIDAHPASAALLKP